MNLTVYMRTFFKAIATSPHMVSILQDTNQTIQLEVRRLNSKYGSLNPYSKIREATGIIKGFELYSDFIVDYLTKGAFMAKTKDDLYQMLSVDLYMNGKSRLLSSHQA